MKTRCLARPRQTQSNLNETRPLNFTGKKTEALAALEWLRGPDFDKYVEIDQMEDRAKNDQENRGTVKDMFKLARTPFLIAASLMVFQQMSGINAALFNATFIFQSTGSTLDPLVSNVLLNVTQVNT